MREIFVTELIKEVLGPRGGIHEILSGSPVDEYITGVLAPSIDILPEPDIDAEAEIPVEESSEEGEEDASEAEITPPPLLAPALNPQNRPHSIGLSFMVESNGNMPVFDICLTWARYERQNGNWKRQPRVALLTGVPGTSQTFWIDSGGNQVAQQQWAEVSLHLLMHPRGHGKFLASMYLVNRIQVLRDQHLTTEHHIFQPQIRVNCANGTRIVPGLEGSPQTEEERELQFLYRHRPVLARGHLCSAVWKKIDPEYQHNNLQIDFPEVLDELPFRWIDGELLTSDDRERFSPPDVRTEFVPVYSIQAPELEWPQSYGDPPETKTEELAELWETSQLQNHLQPLVDGYRRWIESINTRMNSLSQQNQLIANRLIQECERVADRIQRTIDLLMRDENVRLAFCFAMKAIAIQSTWPLGSGKPPLRWHPFQLAFILITLESIANPVSPDRDVCDLLWVPTGAGKTEAYLALAAFTMAYRRRRALVRHFGDRTGAGVAVISRYTLRLLAIQQFRRTLKMVTACEYLRVHGFRSGNPVGWRPSACPISDNFIWGSSRFSAGLWVGGGVTPNRFEDIIRTGEMPIYGAKSILRGQRGEGEPAQILKCPVCDSILSIPQRERQNEESGLRAGRYVIHLVIHGNVPALPQAHTWSYNPIVVHDVQYNPLYQHGYATLTVEFSTSQKLAAQDIDQWWGYVSSNILNNTVNLVCVRASRPGYFFRWYRGQRNQQKIYDFEIFCPNPECFLRQPWCEGMPLGWICETNPTPGSSSGGLAGLPQLYDGNLYVTINSAFRINLPYISDRIPVPAWTIDEQIYHHCPSMVIATVDKFARPPFEPRAAALFGNVDHYHCVSGFYRQHLPPVSASNHGGHPGPVGRTQKNYVSISPLDPPDLILQDELHLIDGPLGSLVGIYEAAIDLLCSENGYSVKYIASTATVRQAEEQVQSVFCRRLLTFPPPGLTADERFFISFFEESHPFYDRRPGRLYVGICAPGRGPLTPIVRIWARLLHTAWQQRTRPNIDPFWTLVGYFNAIRELAGARALYRQDIPERLLRISGTGRRGLFEERCQELSSRKSSTELPAIFDLLNEPYPDAQDALFTTSMFGTGVDISRLGLMVVHGQPKTTSSYIQATGRVGRNWGALVVTFLRATRPRDLNHYEFFCGYHCQLHRFVEPITVMPFAPGVLDRACGPVGVFILRNRRNTSISWHADSSAPQMAAARATNSEVRVIPSEMEDRSQSQPPVRAPRPGYVQGISEVALDDWHRVARIRCDLRYVEYAIISQPSSPVVLGDPQHQHAGLDVVYRNAPQSLRDIEETCGFET